MNSENVRLLTEKRQEKNKEFMIVKLLHSEFSLTTLFRAIQVSFLLFTETTDSQIQTSFYFLSTIFSGTEHGKNQKRKNLIREKERETEHNLATFVSGHWRRAFEGSFQSLNWLQPVRTRKNQNFVGSYGVETKKWVGFTANQAKKLDEKLLLFE